MTTLKQRAIGLESLSHRIAGMKTGRLEAFSDGETLADAHNAPTMKSL
jgi:hypothetical protein